MKPLFPPWSNSVFRWALGVIAVGVVAVPSAAMIFVRTPYVTGEGEPVVQPVMFDHRHHVRDDGIDCRYCHHTVEKDSYASVPAASVCMGCHAQVWSDSPLLEPVRRAWFDEKPLAWEEVDRLPDFVYFDHSIHVKKGVGCVVCHGRVDRMARLWQARSLSMSFCLDCHRNPEGHLREPDRVTDLWSPPPADKQHALAASLDVRPPTNCSGCHR